MPGQLLLEHVGNKLPHKPTWEKLVKAWGVVLDRYLQHEEGLDIPHWNTERSLTGFLAAAVWIRDGVALVEYATERHEENSDDKQATVSKGSCDLYIHLDDLDCAIEAKQDWPSDSSNENINRIRQQLKSADDQLDTLPKGKDQASVGMAICWVVPKLDPNAPNEEDVLKKLADAYIKSDHVVAIYHVPRKERASLKDEEAENDGRRYPGVILVGRRIWSH